MLYVGVTNNLVRRVGQHRRGDAPGFTSTYKVMRLVHYEPFMQIRAAIGREKQIKRWNRQKKIRLIEEHNPQWNDLWNSIVAAE